MTEARYRALLDGARERFDEAMLSLPVTAVWDEPVFHKIPGVLVLRCHWDGYCERRALESNVSFIRADKDLPAAIEDGVAWLVGAFAYLTDVGNILIFEARRRAL
jgi:hypothetical protein